MIIHIVQMASEAIEQQADLASNFTPISRLKSKNQLKW